jgi:predicted Rossmann fold nucleotide-binding protein DprA/Smf involved in DNA uptake
MKVAIVGSRTINDEKLVIDFINECHSFDTNYDKIISGGARGVDTIAEKYAKTNCIRTVIFTPDWDKYGNRAGFIRNADIISKCDKCIVVWDGESSGTKHDIKLCTEMRKPCFVFNVSTNEKYELNNELTLF